MANSLRCLTLLASLSVIAACGTGPSDPNNQLTDAEAAFLAEEFAGVALQGVSGSMAGSPDLGSAPANASGHDGGPVTWERTFTETRPCPAGGTRTTSGSNKGTIDETHSGTVEVTHSLVMEDCARTRDDVTITVNTDPAITFTGTVTIENGERAGGTFTKTGAFVWETSDGRSGRCEIDLTITWSGDDGWDREGNHTVTGTICGRDVAELRRHDDRKP